MIKIGITGGIGSGKSFVAKQMEEKGIPVYYTDDMAKQLMAESPVIREKLTELLGEDAYLSDGQPNKKKLIDYLFANKENALRINSIVHPVVKSDFQQWAERHKSTGIVAMECAILYEAGFDDVVDRVAMVYAPLEIRIERAMKRDGTTRQQVTNRINAQMPDEEKRRRADYTIYNDGIRPIPAQIDTMLKQVKSGKPLG